MADVCTKGDKVVASPSKYPWWLIAAELFSGFLIGAGSLLVGLLAESDTPETISLFGETEWSRGVGITLCVVAYTVGLIVFILVKIVSNNRNKEHDRTVPEFINDLHNVIEVFERLLASDAEREDFDQYLEAQLGAVCKLFRQPEVRICLYSLDSSEWEDQENRDYLQLLKYKGRVGKPRSKFDSTPAHGRRLIAVAKQQNTWHVRKPKSYGDQVDWHPSSAWQSFFAFPIEVNNKSLGVLIVDSPSKKPFTKEDEAVGRFTVELIRFAFEQMGRKERSESTRDIDDAKVKLVAAIRKMERRGGEHGINS